MNSSSPIRINEATADELCKLEQIGEKRAERIVRYRQEVESIRSIESLATAAGISYRLAERIANDIDWGQERPSTRSEQAIAVVSLAACSAIIIYSLTSTPLDMSSTGAIMYNIAIILILGGCGLAIADIVTPHHNRLSLVIHITTIATWATGAGLLAALVISSAIGGSDDELSLRILTSWKFAVFAAIVALLQLGPALVLRFVGKHIERIAFAFDFGQLPLIVAIFLLTPLGDDASLLEEIFCIWAGIIFLFNGWQLAHGRSSFVAALSDTDRSVLDFMVREDGTILQGQGESTGAHRIAGITLAAMGVMLAVTAALDWWLR